MKRTTFARLRKLQEVTPEGLIELEARLDTLLRERQDIREWLHNLREEQASDKYDWSDTMRELESLDGQIEQSRIALRQVVVVQPKVKPHVAQVGAIVHLQNGSKSIMYKLVSSLEADPMHGKISNESPLGKALLGKKIHQLVQYVSPKKGILRYKITKLQ